MTRNQPGSVNDSTCRYITAPFFCHGRLTTPSLHSAISSMETHNRIHPAFRQRFSSAEVRDDLSFLKHRKAEHERICAHMHQRAAVREQCAVGLKHHAISGLRIAP